MTRLGFNNRDVRGRMGISFCEMSSRNRIEFSKRISSDATSSYFVYLPLQAPLRKHVAERCTDHLTTMQCNISPRKLTIQTDAKLK